MGEISQSRVRTVREYEQSLTDPYGFVYARKPYLAETSLEGVTSYRSGKLYTDDPYDYLSGKDLRKSYLRDGARGSRNDFDNGHEFRVSKNIRENAIMQTLRYPGGPAGDYVYRGPIELSWPFASPWIDAYEYMPNLKEVGASFIRNTIPTRPVAALTAFLGELREGLPRLVGVALAKQRAIKSVGGEYLNVTFGWKPLASDIQKLARSVRRGNALVRQLERDSGRNVRRKRAGRWETESKDFGTSNMNCWLPSFDRPPYDVTNQYLLSPRQVRVQVFDNVRSRSWFAGAYTYHWSTGDDLLGRLDEFERQANYLLGTRLTPDTIWQLTPWSWLFDWFANMGTILGNAEAFTEDSLVLRYGYLMHEIHATRYLISAPVPTNTWEGRSAPVLITYESVIKTRTRATPYGFGLDVGNFSPSKWAILGALGMSKSPGALRL